FTYSLKGLYVNDAGEILERDTHLLEVNLSLDYPQRAPQCRMLTPVFHPNFDDASVCIGDFWAPSEALDDLVVRIGRMIAYQEYNTRSPLNGLAAKWGQKTAICCLSTAESSPPAVKRTGCSKADSSDKHTLQGTTLKSRLQANSLGETKRKGHKPDR
ncbi:MAG TPA: ubiquitin-conjugating enzyme E2, partial [Edaphobacter sp.]|nr:ubiquitin-conjugating enzyme E2 [Edaphobacter sp.]